MASAPWATTAALRLLRLLRCLLAIAALHGSAVVAAEGALQVAVLDGERMRYASLEAADGRLRDAAMPSTLQAPLGSLWKLFVHAWLVAHDSREADYGCRGGLADEAYCCAAGQQIDREQALVRSCGLYFDPQRLGLSALDWQRHWQARGAPSWLSRLERMRPDTVVPVVELLQALALLPARAALRDTLLDVVLAGDDAAVVGALGSRLRVKTWSWHAPDQRRIGGAAGWLSDGSPVWIGGSGTGPGLLRRHAATLAAWLPQRWPAEAGPCVLVEMFARYPIAAVRLRDGTPAEPGRLDGRFEVHFDNGNKVDVDSGGELLLTHGANPSRLQLTARLDREDYVARVIDREAAPEPVEAARALAVVARSYLLQQASRDGDCLQVADSTSRQRVAPRPPSEAARAIAAFTAGLVLAGQEVRYHHDRAEPGRLAWTRAVAQARAGQRFDTILAEAFPRASLSRWSRPEAACRPLESAERWLAERLPQWRPLLDRELGYEQVDVTVCVLPSGRPRIDREKRRIYIRALRSEQDRLDLLHEYLHLAFDRHPHGQDEVYVEQLSRRLLQH